MKKQKNLFLGVLAGATGGLVAAWVVNDLVAPSRKQFRSSKQSGPQGSLAFDGEVEQGAPVRGPETIDRETTARYLSREFTGTTGPVVDYAFGALVGGIYGGLAEYSSTVTAGLGTRFGGAVFSRAGLIAIPALRLSLGKKKSPAPGFPLFTQIVYGVTTEFVRRIVRAMV